MNQTLVLLASSIKTDKFSNYPSDNQTYKNNLIPTSFERKLYCAAS
jgi:hypothetical protein